jgi:hypothetical protein
MGDLFNEPKAAKEKPKAEERIDTLSDAMAALVRMFPKYAAEIDAWTNAYKRVLGTLGPADLQQTWQATIDAWSRSVPPKPADFAVHRPAAARAPNPEAAAQIRDMRITIAAQAEQKALIERSLKAHAETMAAYSRQMASLPTIYAGSISVNAADMVRSAFVFHVKRKAWAVAVETARGGPSIDHIDLVHADWATICQHAETMPTAGGNAARAAQRKPNPFDEQRRAEMRRRADEWHERHFERGEPVTADERRAGAERDVQEAL